MHEAHWTFTAESADEVDTAELALHRVRVTLVLVDTSLASLIHFIAGWTRAAIAARNVLTASHWLASTCLLHALVYIFIDHTRTNPSRTVPTVHFYLSSRTLGHVFIYQFHRTGRLS